MSVSESETIYPESEISEDESLHSSDEDFIADSDSESEDEDEDEDEDEEYIPPKRKRRNIEFIIKI